MTRTIRLAIIVAVLLLAIIAGCAIATAAATVNAAAVPTATACAGALARFRADAPAAQLTRAAPISKTTFVVEIPFSQPGWAHACVSGYWIETKYLDLGIADASSTPTPTLVPLTATPTATTTQTATATPTRVTADTGLWIVANGVAINCGDPCKFEVRSKP